MEEQVVAFPNTLDRPRPWLRFWARNFDLLIHTVAIVLIWTVLHQQSIDRIPDSIFSVLISFIWIFIEWIYIVSFGTTPGKKIMGIQIRTEDGANLSKYVALKRSRLVWLRGMGVGAGIIQIIANIIGYSNLKRDHITTWDRDLNLKVIHKKIGIMRMLICPMMVICIFLLAMIGIVFG